ncbi:MAG: cell wall hydrolase [Bacteroidales bacterium]|nr:cell wall hydrolase [Candidatus Liminaster caballi]
MNTKLKRLRKYLRKFNWYMQHIRWNRVAIVLIIFVAAVVGFAKLVEKEQAERRRIELEWIREQEAAERAYEAEVQAEKDRWAEIEAWDDLQVAKEGEARELTSRDIEEMDYWGELELLALVVEAEAGNQDLTGKRLVVDVVLNRVDCPLFPNTITEVLEQENQFTTMWNGAVEKAAWNMQDSDYAAVMLEVTGQRLDTEIMYFTAGGYNESCTPAYIHGDHYFGYLSKAAQKEVVELNNKK